MDFLLLTKLTGVVFIAIVGIVVMRVARNSIRWYFLGSLIFLAGSAFLFGDFESTASGIALDWLKHILFYISIFLFYIGWVRIFPAQPTALYRTD